MNRLHAVAYLALVAALLAGCQTAKLRDAPAPTVGQISQHRDPGNNWVLKQLVVRTTSTLSVQAPSSVEAEAATAIEQYEALLELDGDPSLRAEAMRRAADLRLQRAESADVPDAADVERAIALYTQLLAEHPGYARNDRALYQLARAQQLAGETEDATQSLRMLGARFPESERTADARFRAAELLYQRGRYAEAETEYRAVLDFGPELRFFEPAQYKHGWALYQQHKYAAALPVFLAILDRELPQGVLEELDAALARVAPAKAELATDALRGANLAFAALGGGIAISEQLAASDRAQRYAPLLYVALGAWMLERQRYSDAAETYASFIERYPDHARAPAFQTRVIEAYAQGGFSERVLAAKQTYAERYAPDAAYWRSSPSADVIATLRTHLDDLARHHHALAQALPAEPASLRAAAFLAAANWHRRVLELYPEDAQRADTRLLYADSLLEGGRVGEAAEQYLQTAYAEPRAQPRQAAEAAHAAMMALRTLVREAPPASRAAALRESVDASLKLADRFEDHPHRAAALAHAAADLIELGKHEQAIAVARRVLDDTATVDAALAAMAWSTVADGSYAREEYAQAETAYLALLPLVADDARRTAVIERLAASVYRQAEVAREAGDVADAARLFLRVGVVAPASAIRASADYDAAAAFIVAEDWTQATRTLEGFIARNPAHALVPDADKKLAVAYEKDDKPSAAAVTYLRIAAREAEDADTRRAAAWLAAELYQRARNADAAERAYERYLARWPQPLERALDARRRLADYARDRDGERYTHWLREIVKGDAAAGTQRSDRTRLMSAQASLEIGRVEAANARRVALSMPIERSLPRRKAASEAAIAAFVRASDFGYAEVTTAATYELALVYRDLGRALLDSARPSELRGEALEQYELLLEERAYPFEESAIKAHEANLGRLGQGLWNDWVRRSAWALTEMAPAKYGKHERRETTYDSPS